MNDGISQDVLETLRTADEKFPDLNITIINMGFSHGLEAAMNAGIDLSIGDFVFEFDSCYMDYDKSLIMDVYFKSLEGYDIVSALIVLFNVLVYPPLRRCIRQRFVIQMSYFQSAGRIHGFPVRNRLTVGGNTGFCAYFFVIMSGVLCRLSYRGGVGTIKICAKYTWHRMYKLLVPQQSENHISQITI